MKSAEPLSLELPALQATVPGNKDVIFGITVGSEILYRGDFTPNQLLGMIQQVQNAFPDLLVGTADSWTAIANGTADPLIKGGVKLMYRPPLQGIEIQLILLTV